MIDAAEAVGVKRFVIDDFGWGPDIRGLSEFAKVHKLRRAQWEYASVKGRDNPGFTWTGITSGNPIDWVSKMDLKTLRASRMLMEVRFRP